MVWNFTFCSNARKLTNKLPFIYQTLVKGTKYKEHVFFKSFHSSPKNAFKVENSRSTNKQGVSDVNTNVQNNVILYKCDRKSDIRKLRLCFIGTVCIHILVATSTYDPKYFSNINKHATWSSYFMDNGIYLLLFIYAVTIGPLASTLAYLANKRFVKYVILHKGGKVVSLITNHAFKSHNTITLPIDKVQTNRVRDTSAVYLSLKLQGYKFHFFLDGQGKYLNEELFDHTVGIQKH